MGGPGDMAPGWRRRRQWSSRPRRTTETTGEAGIDGVNGRRRGERRREKHRALRTGLVGVSLPRGIPGASRGERASRCPASLCAPGRRLEGSAAAVGVRPAPTLGGQFVFRMEPGSGAGGRRRVLSSSGQAGRTAVPVSTSASRGASRRPLGPLQKGPVLGGISWPKPPFPAGHLGGRQCPPQRAGPSGACAVGPLCPWRLPLPQGEREGGPER